jgi:hypothetical protein
MARILTSNADMMRAMVYRTFYAVLAMIPVIIVLGILDVSRWVHGLILASTSFVVFFIALRWRNPR